MDYLYRFWKKVRSEQAGFIASALKSHVKGKGMTGTMLGKYEKYLWEGHC